MIRQTYSKTENVLQAAIRRISFVFDNFENVQVSVSGGKDSTVLAYLALLEANRRNRKVGLFFLDEEVVYESTIEQIRYLMSLFPENTNKLWVQIPFNLTNSVSLVESQLHCWEHGKHKEWMRSKESGAIWNKLWEEKNEKHIAGYNWLDFYGAIVNWENCYTNTAFLVGLRAAGESPNRWRAVVKNPVNINGNTVFWATKKGENKVLYPIYDWNFHDIWRFIHESKLKYSKIYDFQFKKGFSISEMRVSSLIHERSFKSLCELPEFEPKTFDKLCKRIKGIQFAQETAKDSKMFKVRKLPKNFNSWITYRDFLLQTYPVLDKKPIFEKRFSKQLTNEYVARQQVRQLVLNDYENNLPIDNKIDPREELLNYYKEVL